MSGPGSVSVATGGKLLLSGGTLQGSGTLTAATSSQIEVTGTGTIDGRSQTVSLSGTTTIDHATTLTILGPIGNAGAIAVNGTSGYPRAVLLASGTASLSGGGTVHLFDDYTPGGDSAAITGSSTADTLDNIDNTIYGVGEIGLGTLTLSNDAAATVDATVATLFVNTGASAITNAGLLEATSAGTLDVASAIVNTGRILAADTAQVTLRAAVTGLGSVSVATGGKLLLSGGTLQGSGTLTAATSSQIEVTGTGTIDGRSQTVSLSGTTTIDHATTLTILGPIGNAGAIAVNGTSGYPRAVLLASGTASLSGGGTVHLFDDYTPGGDSAAIAGSSAADTLDNVDNTIFGAGEIGLGTLTLSNDAAATVDATVATLFVNTGASAITNAGLLEATSAGTLDVASAIVNTGRILAADTAQVTLRAAVTGSGSVSVASGGKLLLASGGLLGTGSLASVAGAQIEATGTAAIDGRVQSVKLAGTTKVDHATTLTVQGLLSNTGAFTVEGTSGYANAVLLASGAVTLGGGGTLHLFDDYTTSGQSAVVTGTTAADTLDNANNTIFGYGQLGAGSLGITNEAAGVVNASDGRLVIDTGSSGLTNTGLVEATAGATLDLESVVANAGGRIHASDGTTIRLGADGITALVAGGRIETDGTGVIMVDQADATLDGRVQTVTLANRLDLHRARTLTVEGTLANDGLLSVQGSSGYAQAILRASGAVTLSGGGSVHLFDDYNPAGGSAAVTGSSAADTLDNVDNTIYGAGELGLGKLVLTNEAAATVDATGATLFVNTGAASVVNAGLMEATAGGTLDLASNVANAGSLVAAATGQIALHAAVTGAGSLNVASGGKLLLSNGALLGTGSLASVAGGTIEATGTDTIDGRVQTISLAGTTKVDHATTLTVQGLLSNTGAFTVEGTSGYANAVLLASGAVTLGGGGTLHLFDDYTATGQTAVVTGTAAADTLDNTDNTIFGYGQLGAGALSLANEAAGTIDAQTGTLTIDTGGSTTRNAGLLEATTGTLAIKSAILNKGTVQAAGGTVTLASGAAADLVAGVLGGGTWRAAGGSIAFSDALTADAAKLILDGAGSTISAAGSSLEQSLTSIGTGGSLQVLGNRDFAASNGLLNAGEIRLGGGTFAEGVINNIGLIDGSGTLAGPVINSGTIEATGILAITGTVSGALAVDAGATLSVQGAVGPGSLGFTTGGTARFAQSAGLSNLQIGNFAAGDTIDLQDLAYVPGVTSGAYSTTTGQLQVSNGSTMATLFFGAGNSVVNDPFHFTSDLAGGTLITNDAAPACYCPGTAIATPSGERAIETLAIGDMILTASGGCKPVRWIGRRAYAARFVANNRSLLPIRFRAGSLGENLPHRDLLVSPNHAMLLDGALVPAEHLVNGSGIVREGAIRQVSYIHLELDEHDVILAEGAASETFLDDGSRGCFHNAAEYAALYPAAPVVPLYCAARIESGYALDAIRARLAAIGVCNRIAAAV